MPKVLANYECLDVCPIRYRLGEDGQTCLRCNYKCMQCFGPSDKECLECDKKYFKLKTYCLEFCALGFYMDSQSKECNACYDGCLTCTDSSENSCSACQKGWWFYNLRCQGTCPMERFYPDNITQTCTPCYYRC